MPAGLRSTFLFFSLSLFFLFSPPSLERGGGERGEHLKKKSAEKTWELLNKNLTQTSPAGGLQMRCGRSRAGASKERQACSTTTPTPTPALSFFSRKRKQKGILCGGSVWGELPAGCQRQEEGHQHCSPSCLGGAGPGACGEPFGVLASGRGQHLFCGCSPLAAGTAFAFPWQGAEGSLCSPGSLLAGASISLKPSAPCLLPHWRLFFFPSPQPRLLCRSFLWAFLKVNQGENCSWSCLEATRG